MNCFDYRQILLNQFNVRCTRLVASLFLLLVGQVGHCMTPLVPVDQVSVGEADRVSLANASQRFPISAGGRIKRGQEHKRAVVLAKPLGHVQQVYQLPDAVAYESSELIEGKNAEIKRVKSQLWIISGIGLLALLVMAVKARACIRARAIELENVRQIGVLKETMVNMIVHDLKNPLNALLNGKPEKIKTKRMAQSMLGLVTNVLDVYRLESQALPVSKQKIDLEQLLKKASMQVGHLLEEKNICLEIRQNRNAFISADLGLMERILVNLLTNAIKYSPLNERVIVEATYGKGSVCLSVSDGGPGIDKADVEKIFNPYTQVNPKRSGGVVSTGLGLSFCKLALESQGSNIQVISEKGKGTTFRFEFEATAGECVSELSVQTQSTPCQLTLDLSERKQAASHLRLLQQMKVHQVSDIRNTLTDLKKCTHQNQEAAEAWGQTVLRAVYQGNDQEYDRLINQLA